MQIRTRCLGWSLLAALGVAGTQPGCKPTPLVEPNPQPGTLTLTIQSSGARGHAFLIEITGQASNPSAVDDAHLLFHSTTGSGLRLILVGSIGSGPVARFQVPDVGQAASYSAQVVEAADDLNRLMPPGEFTARIDR